MQIYDNLQGTITRLSNFAKSRSEELIQLDVKNWLTNITYLGQIIHGGEFEDTNTWWGNGGSRKNKHEGIDIPLPEKYAVPAIYPGKVIGVIPNASAATDTKTGLDYIGQTIILAHEFKNDRSQILVSIYGHLDLIDIESNNTESNNIIGYIAKPKTVDLPPHLHLSIGWLQKIEKIYSWNQINFQDCSHVKLFNPLIFSS